MYYKPPLLHKGYILSGEMVRPMDPFYLANLNYSVLLQRYWYLRHIILE